LGNSVDAKRCVPGGRFFKKPYRDDEILRACRQLTDKSRNSFAICMAAARYRRWKPAHSKLLRAITVFSYSSVLSATIVDKNQHLLPRRLSKKAG
jgi:hypothetical protein